MVEHYTLFNTPDFSAYKILKLKLHTPEPSNAAHQRVDNTLHKRTRDCRINGITAKCKYIRTSVNSLGLWR
jgi:hypothetical protein